MKLVLPVLLALPGACAPARFADGVPWSIRRSHTTNARAQFVRERPYLRFNAFLLDELTQVQSADDAATASDLLLCALDESHDLAIHVLQYELDRLPMAEVEKLLDRYFGPQDQFAHPREALRTRFLRVVEANFVSYRQTVESIARLDDLRKEAKALQRACLPSPKDHHGGRIATGMVALTIKEERGPLDHGGPDVDLYTPNPALYAAGEEETDIQERDRLARYAPIILQERVKDPDYEPDTDLIGTIRLAGLAKAPKVAVDTKAPSVYAYHSDTLIGGERHAQLTYTYWFPRHPKLKFGDAEAGDIEGATLRITLDRDGRPLIFETLLNCGCYHRCYPSDALESAACDSFGAPLKGKRFCVERKVAGRMDWILPEVVDVPAVGERRPILFSRAGYHGPAGITFDRKELADRTVRAERAYQLRRYDELEHLSVDDGYGSMFLDNGLVRGAERLEGALLALTGMLSAGQPRQRGTQLLHWDQYDLDDPHLLETCLRIPSGF